MRIVYCDHYAGSPELGMEFRPFQLAREWVRLGHDVTIVGGSYSHLRVRNPTPGRETLDGVEFLWLETPEYRGNGLARIRSMVAYCLGLRSWEFSQAIPPAPRRHRASLAGSTYG
ncbi:MAG: glycosyltransferase WbuB, partial [Phycisphaerales bacterium]